jgi:pyrroline-5-carboxylate reductase
MTLQKRISFLGGGNMASALIEGLVSAGTSRPAELCATDVRKEALESLAAKHGVRTTQDNAQACDADVIVLSVKPQVFPALLPEIAPHVGRNKLVISIAAGVPLSVIEQRLGDGARVIRAMPNTPALVAAGATAIAAGRQATPEDMAVAQRIFDSVGVCVQLREELMDAVTALSGSGPAYVYLLAEALIDAGVRVGLAPADASRLALQTILGAAKLLTTSSDAPAELRRKVTSPGGTTQAGIGVLESRGMRDIVTAAVTAARDRGAELGREAAEKLAKG